MRYHRIDRDRCFESRRQACRHFRPAEVCWNADSWVRNRARPCSIGAIDSHCAADRHVLLDNERRFLLTRRVGHLATADSRAIPHVLPVCFTISQGTLYITIDEKPKRVAGAALKRVRNIERNPMVAVWLIDTTRTGPGLGGLCCVDRLRSCAQGRNTITRRSCFALGTASWRLCRSPNSPSSPSAWSG